MATQDKNVKFITGTDSINAFLKMARKCKKLTKEEEINLFNTYFNNELDEKVRLDARDKIVMSQMLYVYSHAKEYCADEDEILDYVNEGILGLYEAVENFDITKGTRFITCAVLYIRRSMNYYMMNTRDAVTKSNNMKIGKKVDYIRDEYMAREQRMPSMDEIREELSTKYNIDVVDNRDLYDLNIESISASIDTENNTLEDLGDFAMRTASVNEYDDYCETHEEDGENKSDVSKLLAILPKKNRDMICMYYGIGYDFAYDVEAIADKYGMYIEDVEALVKKTVAYLTQESDTVLGKTA